MKSITVDKLKFKKQLSVIEQITLKDFLYTWVGGLSKGLEKEKENDIFHLEYTEDAFAKMEKTTNETDFLISDEFYFRYITITEDNKIVIGILDRNSELKHKIISLQEIK
ncbi:hypothetical protein A8F94_14625 [Bacillus sp. FJAT-27225]|uniref:hypothetical protein n=1 Tax=Bacillus sp. FJAT-27225 TaxID=1743144 RepID=UPI00080C228B|nr:hypothetical protein [Bacillus sp. FJAT-27225]OCA86072.1 hypothetical protein A8F94_14625 [Bacillus sp. FJAT-27225]